MSSASELASPERKKLATSLRILLPSTACMIFTISVMLTAKDELSASVIIDGILKLSALPADVLRHVPTHEVFEQLYYDGNFVLTTKEYPGVRETDQSIRTAISMK